ncbi:MAG: hypothetical protein IJZ38_07410 [Bacteroides sp.]|nr:hypothetical protein [Bacteroides sp.]
MNENVIAVAKKSQKDLSAMEEMMDRLHCLMKAEKQEEAEALLQKLMVMSQQVALRHRELALGADDPDVRVAAEKIIAEENPVEIGFTGEGWFALRMMPLARTKDTASKAYIRGIIFPAMKRFFADKPTVRFPACTVVYRHVYDRDLPESGYRDYDNVEVKLVTDAVAMYVMVDDSPKRCRMYHCTAPGPASRTEVYVMPQEDLLKWTLMEPDFPDEGVTLTNQVPEQWKADI